MTWAREVKTPLLLSILFISLGFVFFKTNNNYSVYIGMVWELIGIVALIEVIIFYRDPERKVDYEKNIIISPADGKVVAVEEVEETQHINGKAIRIAIFMHVANVHIQRMPIDAHYLWAKHVPGKYFPAFDPKAARENEQHWYAFEKAGKLFSIVQIAGLLARRTRNWLGKTSGHVQRGDKFGMITLGSEVDMYLPIESEIHIKRGDNVLAGLTKIGEWK